MTTNPIIPTGGVPAIPPATVTTAAPPAAPAAPATPAAAPAAAPAIARDANTAVAAAPAPVPAVNLEAVDLGLKQLQALDDLVQNFLADGNFSKEEMALYKEFRTLLKGNEGKAAPAPGGAAQPPAGGAAQPPAGGAAQPPAGGAAQPPAGGAAQPPAGGAAQPPAGGAAQNPVGGAAQNPVGGAAQVAAPGGAQAPAKPFNLDQAVSDMLNFMQMDGKNDGVIYGKKAAPLREFNTDGVKGISLQEFLVAQAKKRGDFDPNVNYAALAVAGREFVGKDTKNKKDGVLADGTTLRDYVKKRMDEVQPQPQPQPQPAPGADAAADFAKRDRNQDGKLQQAEWLGIQDGAVGISQAKAEEWEKLDADKDGTLSREEFAKQTAAPQGGGATLPDTKLPTQQQLEVLNNLRDLFLQDGQWSAQDQSMYTSIRKELLNAEATPATPQAGGLQGAQQALRTATAEANAVVQRAATAPAETPNAAVQTQFAAANQEGQALLGDAEQMLRDLQAATAAAQPAAQ